MSQGIGAPVRRKEDLRLLTGRGCYGDDVSLPGQAFAWLVRSSHAHATIGPIATGAARDAPGVLTVLDAADDLADGRKPLAHGAVPIDAVDPRKASRHYQRRRRRAVRGSGDGPPKRVGFRRRPAGARPVTATGGPPR